MPGSPSNRIPPLRLALLFTIALLGFSFLPWVGANLRLAGSFWAAVLGLLVFNLVLRYSIARSGRVLRYEYVPKRVHYVQLTMHASIYIYWGWYWREVYHYIPLILAQIVFVYAFDMLLCWSRRDTWLLGFGPIPIVLSANLFLWFKDDWFFLQFALVATGVVCKEFITWNRDGRRAHIFNPSAVALFIFSIGLLLTHSTHITWGEEVSVTLGRPPHIYLEIFLLGLVVQALFSVTLVTLSATMALCALNLMYTGWTGVYHFVDSNIPIAVFLGLHLLVTDPATSPRKTFGKIMFGGMYGAGVFAMYAFLGRLGLPTFYDKLLCVPPLNLLVQALDRASVALAARWRRIPAWNPRNANFAHMAIWIVLFAVMMTTGFVSGRHPGSNPEFWQKACAEGRRNACQTWMHTIHLMCQYNSAYACYTEGLALNEGRAAPRSATEAGRSLGRACDLGMVYGCVGLVKLVAAEGPEGFQGICDRGDGEGCFILGSLYHAGQGVRRDDALAFGLFRQSCADGWWRGCARVAESYQAGQGTEVNPGEAIEYFEKACRAGHAASCFNVAVMYRHRNEETLARERFTQACDFSVQNTAASAAYFRPGSSQSTAKPPFCSPPNP
jgi:TPR repeat protein